MKQSINRLLSMPYWAVSLLVSVVFAAGLLTELSLAVSFADAIRIAPVFGLLSLCGFAVVRFTMPGKAKGVGCDPQ